MKREDALPYAESFPGESTEFFSNLCKELGVAIAFDMVEHELINDLLYNSAALIGSNGKIIGTYRKTHIFSTGINFVAVGNSGLSVFDSELGKIGIFICEDTVHFETSRLLAVQKMDILLVATCWVDISPNEVWRSRAAENGVYVVCTDWWNTSREGNNYGGGKLGCVLYC